jgi:hypothetical protein
MASPGFGLAEDLVCPILMSWGVVGWVKVKGTEKKKIIQKHDKECSRIQSSIKCNCVPAKKTTT